MFKALWIVGKGLLKVSLGYPNDLPYPHRLPDYAAPCSGTTPNPALPASDSSPSDSESSCSLSDSGVDKEIKPDSPGNEDSKESPLEEYKVIQQSKSLNQNKHDLSQYQTIPNDYTQSISREIKELPQAFVDLLPESKQDTFRDSRASPGEKETDLHLNKIDKTHISQNDFPMQEMQSVRLGAISTLPQVTNTADGVNGKASAVTQFPTIPNTGTNKEEPFVIIASTPIHGIEQILKPAGIVTAGLAGVVSMFGVIWVANKLTDFFNRRRTDQGDRMGRRHVRDWNPIG